MISGWGGGGLGCIAPLSVLKHCEVNASSFHLPPTIIHFSYQCKDLYFYRGKYLSTVSSTFAKKLPMSTRRLIFVN